MDRLPARQCGLSDAERLAMIEACGSASPEDLSFFKLEGACAGAFHWKPLSCWFPVKDRCSYSRLQKATNGKILEIFEPLGRRTCFPAPG